MLRRCLVSGAGAATHLWQVQLAGGNTGAFAFRILTVAREALLEYPNAEVRTLKDLETVLQIRLVVGSPAQAGPSDPDGLGFVDWQLAIYATSLEGALSFVHFVLNYKVQKGYLASMPELAAHVADVGADALPDPWQPLRDANLTLPKPFSVLPPKGRRHVIVQLEKQVEEVGSRAAAYILTFYGGIYNFKDRFEDKGVPGTLVATSADAEHKDYVRYLEVKVDTAGMQQVEMVLEEVLKGMPLYFVNMAGDSDVMAIWLQKQPSIVQAEEPTET